MNFYLKIGGKKIYVNEEVYKRYRRSQRREKYLHEQEYINGVVSIEELYSPPASNCNVEEEYERSEVSKKLWNALNKLSVEEFEFVNLHFFEDYSLKEIAKVKNASYIRCWRKRKAILEKLREMLKDIER